ncbi:hypothetical protein B0P06_002675 [Clostridium saccharoperbutylacetonicum]|uniref:hypothetical protein n=1 Tax=Clostridium saccharoperbutylacetonicum TaxID=36745 RepID=UPI000349470C|nr:hypothetical protein [Clostridium saccharoperbutylacetonicum]NRT60222.1 hypothetical protein [Clostridium saccharoperbutylacetonicum]NSB23534.1 hypothetical protein [Clostridium saccharoperbutylacetonicum]NSB42904.1 hypothetical protein [Clostridium saccharoperbutylacetonicum]
MLLLLLLAELEDFEESPEELPLSVAEYEPLWKPFEAPSLVDVVLESDFEEALSLLLLLLFE